MRVSATIAFQAKVPYHKRTSAREMASQKWWWSLHVSANIAFQAQVPYQTLTSVKEMGQSKVVRECACECNHRISGANPLSHTAKCEGDEPVKSGGRVWMRVQPSHFRLRAHHRGHTTESTPPRTQHRGHHRRHTTDNTKLRTRH